MNTLNNKNKRNNILILIFLILFVSNSYCQTIVYNETRAQDSITLVKLYNAMGGNTWKTEYKWDLTKNMDTWSGVSLNDLGRVNRLDLVKYNLKETLYDSLFRLKQLAQLNLNSNSITGSIPDSWNNFFQLNFLSLDSNKIEGKLVSKFSDSLETFSISVNKITSIENFDFSKAKKVKFFSAAENAITTFPTSLQYATNLTSLVLRNNKLSGSIPSEIGNLDKLIGIDLSFNDLEGSIPSSIGNLKNLERLILYVNKLSGKIPEEMKNLTSLKILNLCLNLGNGTNSNVFDYPVPPAVESLVTTNNLEPINCLNLPINQLDSLALVDIYNSTNGANWKDKTNWLTKPIKTWYGVKVETGRVTELKLPNNNLTGTLPNSIGNLTKLQDIRLEQNEIGGTLPSTISNLVELYNFSIFSNKFTGKLPSSLDNLKGIKNFLVGDNNFEAMPIPYYIKDLKDLGVLHLGKMNLTGTIPDFIGDFQNLALLNLEGNKLTGTIPAGIFELKNLAYLRLNDNQLTGDVSGLSHSGNLLDLQLQNNTGLTGDLGMLCSIIPVINLDNTGIKQCVGCDTEIQKQILTEFYFSLDGDNWKNKNNWLVKEKPVGEWYGIKVDENGCVTSIDLQNNGLHGDIPDLISSLSNSLKSLNLSHNFIKNNYNRYGGKNVFSLTKLENLNLSHNLIELTSELSYWDYLYKLQHLDLSYNDIKGDFKYVKDLKSLKSINLSNNLLVYSNVKSFFDEVKHLEKINFENNKIKAKVPDSLVKFTNLKYLNLKNNLIYGDLPKDFCNLSNLDTLILSKNFITGNLFKEVVTEKQCTQIKHIDVADQVNFTPLSLDSLSLITIYNLNDGKNWTDKWDITASIKTWKGVTITNGRISGLNLAGKGLKGNLPSDILDLEFLVTLNISNNDLTRIPNFNHLENLTYLNISKNRLGFNTLEANADKLKTTDLYLPQKNAPVVWDTIASGNDKKLVLFDISKDNKYKWYFRQFQSKDSVVLKINETEPYTFEVLDAKYESMGHYFVEITNSNFPGITLKSDGFFVVVTDKLYGSAKVDDTKKLTRGQVVVYKILHGNFFPVVGTAKIDKNGSYYINDLPLGDYILEVDPADDLEDTIYIKTYYVQTNDWVLADTLKFYNKKEGIDITVLKNNFSKDPTNTARAIGLVEFDEQNSDKGRIEARRKVKKAGCSLRRRVTSSGGRTNADTYEFYAYTETNDEGGFTFGNIPKGFYKVNIQYPGVPIDENSTIEFEVQNDANTNASSKETYYINAVIQDGKIAVNIDRTLGFGDDINSNLVQIAPNPTKSGKITVQFINEINANDVQASIVDFTGKTIVSNVKLTKEDQKHWNLDISSLKNGLYFIVMDAGNGMISRHKIIKN